MKWELRYPGWKTQNHGFDPLRSTCINSPPNWQKSHSLGKAGATSNHKLPVTTKQKPIKRIKTLESWKKGSSAWENRGERCLGRKISQCWPKLQIPSAFSSVLSLYGISFLYFKAIPSLTTQEGKEISDHRCTKG